MDSADAWLERAHRRLLDVRSSYRNAEHPLESIDRALCYIYACFDPRQDALSAVRAARGAVESLLAAESALDAERLSEVRHALASAEPSLLGRVTRPPEALPRFVASNLEPRLTILDRPVLAPQARTVPPSIFAASSGPAPEGFAKDALPALSPDGWRVTRASDLAADLGAAGYFRTPQLADPWRGAQYSEKRALTALDALLALGGQSLGFLESAFVSSPAPLPADLFALAFAGGCTSGRDALALAERAHQLVEDDAEFAESLVDAWSLSPHPHLDALLREWTVDPSPLRRQVGLAALARRQTVDLGTLERALNDVPEVAAEALVPLVFCQAQGTRERLDEVHYRLERAPNELLERRLTEAYLLAGHPKARARTLALLERGEFDGGRWFGIQAEQSDAARLLEWTATHPTPALVDALGWAGDTSALPLLLGLLGVDDASIVDAAANALERITGAGLRDSVLVSPEGAMISDATRPDSPGVLAPGTPRDPAPEGSPDTLELPSRSAERWREYIAAHEAELPRGQRIRIGMPYVPLVSLHQLDRGDHPPLERRALHREIVVRSGQLLWFDERAWVPAQERRIAELRHALGQLGAAPGSFALPMRRS